jgi:hypothetical protein
MTGPLALDRTAAARGDGRQRPLVVGGLVLAATVALRLHDPHQSGAWGYCPFKLLTGLDCPGCGGLRAVNDLTHGQISAAAGSNLVFVASIPLLVGLWAWWLWRGWTGSSRRIPRRVLRPLAAAYLVLLLAFTVIRNTPWGSSLYA